jgi:hypothetical protein
MALLIVMVVFWSSAAMGSIRLPLAGLSLLFVAGLAITQSRSAFLALLVVLGGTVLLYLPRFLRMVALASAERRTKLAAGSIVALAAAGLILSATPLPARVVGTVRTLASQYHYLDSAGAVKFLLGHPQGVGMGLVEPKGALALMAIDGAYHVEGSLFQIAMEMGVWGLAAWLAFWGVALARIYRNFHLLRNVPLKVITGTAFAGWLGSLVAFLFLPLMQSISLMVWLWFLLGAGYQSKSFEDAWEAAEPAPTGS